MTDREKAKRLYIIMTRKACAVNRLEDSMGWWRSLVGHKVLTQHRKALSDAMDLLANYLNTRSSDLKVGALETLWFDLSSLGVYNGWRNTDAGKWVLNRVYKVIFGWGRIEEA